MDFNKLTVKSQEAVARAQELARRAGNPEIYPEHLLLALLEQELARTLVERSGYGLDVLQAQLERMERRMREEIERVHKQYRRDLVPYSQATELLPTRPPRRSWTSTS